MMFSYVSPKLIFKTCSVTLNMLSRTVVHGFDCEDKNVKNKVYFKFSLDFFVFSSDGDSFTYFRHDFAKIELA